MSRLLLVALFALAGCSDATGDNSSSNADDNSANSANADDNSANSANGNPNSANSSNSGANSSPRPDLVEPEGCFQEPQRLDIRDHERDYVLETEANLTMTRQHYGASCGSAMEAEIDWVAVFSSQGFDDDEYDDPGAITAALTPFFLGAREFCFDGVTGDVYRDTVERVVFTATDSEDRIGLCFDEESGALVHRFMLVAGESTAMALEEAEVTDWLATNL